MWARGVCLGTPTFNSVLLLSGEGGAPLTYLLPGSLATCLLTHSPRRRGKNWRMVCCWTKEVGQVAHLYSPHLPYPLAPLQMLTVDGPASKEAESITWFAVNQSSHVRYRGWGWQGFVISPPPWCSREFSLAQADIPPPCPQHACCLVQLHYPTHSKARAGCIHIGQGEMLVWTVSYHSCSSQFLLLCWPFQLA